MSDNTAIGWTDATWPIVAGCEYESPGCSNCWAVRDSWRLAHNPHPAVRDAFAGTVRKTADGKLVWTGLVRPLPERLYWPLRWKKPRRIFVCSQSDLFHPKVPDEFISSVFTAMHEASAIGHIFQVLTKHPQRMRDFMLRYVDLYTVPPSRVWLGVTVEDQKRADERLPLLIATPATVRWVSYEPALELVNFNQWFWQGGAKDEDGIKDIERSYAINWIIFGGESAQTRATTRECDIEWARDLLRQCRDAQVAFFMKQLGSRPVCHVKAGSDGHVELPILHGKSTRYKWHEPQYWPEDLRVQEFPA